MMPALTHTHPFTLAECGLIYRIFHWICIIRSRNDSFREKIRNFLIPSCAFLINIIAVAFNIMHVLGKNVNFATVLPLFLMYTSNFIIFSMLLYKRDSVSKLLKTVIFISQTKSLRKFDIALLVIFIAHMSSVAGIFYQSLQKHKTFNSLNYGVKFPVILKMLFVFLQVLISSFFALTFINLVSLLYCDLCYRCTVSLRNLKSSIKTCPLDAFQEDRQIGIIRRRGEIVNTIKAIQKEFSLVSSLLCFSELLTSFSLLFQVINVQENVFSVENLSRMYFLLNGTTCLCATIIVAGQIPLEMEELRDSIRQKMELKLSHKNRLSEAHMVACLMYSPNVILSASEILHFTRQSAVAIVGTFLTYSALIFSVVKKDT